MYSSNNNSAPGLFKKPGYNSQWEKIMQVNNIEFIFPYVKKTIEDKRCIFFNAAKKTGEGPQHRE
jgi:hypothetical protein